MNRIEQLIKGSIVNKVILLVSIILISVGGILTVNTISFFGVKDSMDSIIDRDVRQIIENMRFNNNLRNTIVLSDLLINTFTERENTLEEERGQIIHELETNTRVLNLHRRTPNKVFQEYTKNLNNLFDQCATINEIIKEINTIEKSLDKELATLDEVVIEKELTIVDEDSEEAESIKQLAIMLPGYREIFFEIILEFKHALGIHLGAKEIKHNHEQEILSLLKEFDIGLHAMPIVWKEIIPYVRNLMKLTSQYKLQVVKLFNSMREFHDHRGVLKLSEKQVMAETSIINNQIIKNSHAIRKKTSEDITSSIRTTILLSSIIILILFVLGVFTVRLVRPIKRLSMGAGKIGAGDLNYKVKINLNDEIGYLAESFNNMTDNLRETTVSKEYVESIIDNMNDALIVSTPEGNIQMINQATCDLLGYQAKELIGESIGKIFKENEETNGTRKKSQQNSEIEKLIHENIKNIEKRCLNKNGNEIPVLFSATTMFDKDKSIQGYVCVASDISDLKRAEMALRDSEEKYKTLVEQSLQGITIIQNNRIVFANEAFAKTSGYTNEELYSLSPEKVIELIHPEDQKLFWGSLKGKLVSKMAPQEYMFRGIHKDGSERSLEMYANLITYDGRPAVQGTVLDITKRKQAEGELAAEKERLRVTLRSIGDGVISSDMHGIIISMNNVAEELTGAKEKEGIGMPLLEIFHIVDEFTRNRCEDPVHKIVKAGGIVELGNNTILISKDGSEYIIAYSCAPIMNNQNKIIGAVLVFRDITEKRKMEEELVKVQKLESLGVLAGGIAHDFNNFLTAMIGNLSLAKLYAKPSDRILSRLDEIEKASLKATNLTQQLLTFSKGGEPVKKLVTLSQLVKDATTFSLRGSNVYCDFLISEDLLPVEVDEGQIGQVINNLVLNADQAMPEGGTIEICLNNITLTANNKFSLPAGAYLKLSFQDNGVGIPPDHLTKIFDPYFTTKHKGGGLGLAVAYSIIDKHNGRLTAESELGKYTTFTIYLPASEKAEIQTENEAKRLFVGEGKILVMDDEDFIRELAIQLLSNMGYEVSVAKDGNEAIEIYRQAQQSKEPFNAVIMDLTIPGGMGGKEAIQKLKELDPNVKAIVSSGYSNDPVMSNFRNYGFEGVVTKPYRIQDMSEALRSVITVRTE